MTSTLEAEVRLVGLYLDDENRSAGAERLRTLPLDAKPQAGGGWKFCSAQIFTGQVLGPDPAIMLDFAVRDGLSQGETWHLVSDLCDLQELPLAGIFWNS